MSISDDVSTFKRDADHYFAIRKIKRSSREAYGWDIHALIKWCIERDLSPYSLTTVDFIEHYETRQIAGIADSTIARQHSALKGFYSWLIKQGQVVENPLLDLEYRQGRRGTMGIASVEHMRALWSAATNPRDRAIIGLLAINSLRVDHLSDARFSDLVPVENRWALRIRGNRRGEDSGTTILAPETHADILEQSQGRRGGYIFLNKNRKPVNRANVARIIERLVKLCDLPDWIGIQSLSLAIRQAAIDYESSYTSVAREAGWINLRTLPHLVQETVMPIERSASSLMAQLIVPRDRVARHFQKAHEILSNRMLPTAVSVMMGGATLEWVLRDAVNSVGIQITKNDPTISTYGDILLKVGIISGPDQGLLRKLQGMRNDACHGWFEAIDYDTATWMLRESELFCRQVLRQCPSLVYDVVTA